MIDIDRDIEIEARKIDEKIKKLQQQKKELAEKIKIDKQRNDLARRVGMIIMSKYEGNYFEYEDFRNTLAEQLTADFDREFFGFDILPIDDPRRPKKRGRKRTLDSMDDMENMEYAEHQNY